MAAAFVLVVCFHFGSCAPINVFPTLADCHAALERGRAIRGKAEVDRERAGQTLRCDSAHSPDSTRPRVAQATVWSGGRQSRRSSTEFSSPPSNSYEIAPKELPAAFLGTAFELALTPFFLYGYACASGGGCR